MYFQPGCVITSLSLESIHLETIQNLIRNLRREEISHFKSVKIEGYFKAGPRLLELKIFTYKCRSELPFNQAHTKTVLTVFVTLLSLGVLLLLPFGTLDDCCVQFCLATRSLYGKNTPSPCDFMPNYWSMDQSFFLGRTLSLTF